MGKDLRGRELGTGYTQRPDGRYEARATVKGVKIDIYNTDLKELQIKFEKAKEEIMLKTATYDSKLTFDGWFYEWFDKYKRPGLKESSIPPTLRKYVSMFQPYIGDKRLTDIKNIDVQTAINEAISSGRAVSTVKDVVGLIRACFESARNNQLIKFNPAFEVQLPVSETKKKLRRYLDERDIRLFLEEIEYSFYKEMYYVMLLTGMRIGEVGALRWCDVDFKKKETNIKGALMTQYNEGVKTMKVTTPKTLNSYRAIPFIGNIEAMYRSWKEKQDELKRKLGNRWRSLEFGEDFVFTSSLGSPMTRYIVEKDLNNIVEAINQKLHTEAIRDKIEFVPMERIYPHALRHTFCSRCFEANMEPKVVQMLMGHANYSTTIDIYTHVTQKRLTDGVAGLDLLNLEGNEKPLTINLGNFDSEHFL